MDKVLILGINGFTGRYFYEYIIEHDLIQNYDFIGVDKSIDNGYKIETKHINLLKANSLEKLLTQEKPEYIVNLVGLINDSEIDNLELTNVEISKNIMRIVLEHNLKIKKILFIGSAAEYGRKEKMPIHEETTLNPVSPYGLSKVLQTVYINYYFQKYIFNVNIARTFNIIGKGINQSLVVGSIVKQIKKAKNGDSIFLGNIDTKRDFLFITDVIDAYWKILIYGKSGETFNVCSGESFRIKDIVNRLIKKSGKNLNLKVNENYVRKNDINDCYGDNTKLKNELGWCQQTTLPQAFELIM